jgi:hypothetical protein
MAIMRLARPVYESLPYVYMAIGGFSIFLFYIGEDGLGTKIAFVIGVVAETAGLTLYLRRQDYRALSREYPGQTIDFPSSMNSSSLNS